MGEKRSSPKKHALKRRCPVCKKLRRFYEHGGTHHAGETWTKIDGIWTCNFCVKVVEA
jgi:hypothetical protein